MSYLRGMFLRGKHRQHPTRGTKQGSVLAILSSLRTLGLRSLNVRLVWLASSSFISGLSQAALLVLVSELAVSRVQGKNLNLHGISISSYDCILACVGLLILFFISGITAAFASSSLSSAAVEASRGKVLDSYFNASWAIQSTER